MHLIMLYEGKKDYAQIKDRNMCEQRIGSMYRYGGL